MHVWFPRVLFVQVHSRICPKVHWTPKPTSAPPSPGDESGPQPTSPKPNAHPTAAHHVAMSASSAGIVLARGRSLQR
jgi:hypothetical protein